MSDVRKIWFLHFAFISICAAGLGWQVFQVSSSYFSYLTDTRIRIKYPSEFTFPTVTICIRYNDIIDYDRANKNGHKWTTSLNYSEVQRVQREIKIREIFDLTPNSSQIIETFFHRNGTGYSYIQNFDGESFESMAKIKKFIYIEYICYRIELKVPINVRPRVVSVHPIASGTLGQITMGKLFKRVTQYKVSLHDRQSLPYESLMVQPIVRRNGKDLKILNTVFAFPDNFTINFLKAPYSTNCFDYTRFYDRAHCVQSCVLENTFKQFTKYPYSAFIENSTDHKLVTYKDADDPESSQKLDRIAEKCEKSHECQRKTCRSSTIITYMNIVDSTDEDFTIVLAVPQRPWTLIDHFPSNSFVTYLTYMMGAFGTWTGLSIFSLNPFAFVIRRRRKQVKEAKRIRHSNSLGKQKDGPLYFYPNGSYAPKSEVSHLS